MDEVQNPKDTVDRNSSPFTECPETFVPCDNTIIPVIRCIEEQGQVRRFDFPVLRTDTKYLCDIIIRERKSYKPGPDKRVRVYRFPFGENKIRGAPGAVKVPQDIQHVSIVKREKDAGIEEISRGLFRHSLHTRKWWQCPCQRSRLLFLWR